MHSGACSLCVYKSIKIKSYSSSFLIVGVTNFEGVGVTKMHNLQFCYGFLDCSCQSRKMGVKA